MQGRDSQKNKIYFDRQNLAPYLKISPPEQDTGGPEASKKEDKTATTHRDEADAAAGGTSASVLQRVSSFSLLPRSASSIGLTGSSETPAAGGGFPLAPPSANGWISHSRDGTEPQGRIVPSWRLRDRMKTVGVGLIMALNVGTDPPDLVKPLPAAKLQCWMDPSTTSRARAKEKIGERLEAQYARWQQQRAARPLKYRRALDPTVEDVRALCLWLRRNARHERILLHINGHGVPRPTANGEIWVFDKNHTEYIPLSITDLRQWMSKPSIVVLDCSSAGILIPFLTAPLSENTPPDSPTKPLSTEADAAEREQYIETMSSQWVKEAIVLAPTSEGEWLPMNPDYPADIFTSCLTTPIKMALRWFVRRNPQSMGRLHPEAVDAIPGKENDRKTPLGELNWIFTAVTDSIAWNMLPKPLFQRLFRQDLLVASMFRNFLLADRILRSLDCTPQSHPPLPPGIDTHPLWNAFDLAMETCLFGLMKDGILGNHVLKPLPPTEKNRSSEDGIGVQMEVTPPDVNVTGPASSISSPFFSEQLTAFEVWLEFAPIRKHHLKNGTHMDSPEQLPVVLQVLLSQVHRIRALTLLRQFLELGPWAVNLSLSLGIFPYVMKLLQSPEYKSLLVSIWASILAFDSSCQVDLVKDGALPHFIQHLTWGLNSSLTGDAMMESAKERTRAAFILSVATYKHPQGQTECSRLNLSSTICALLSSYKAGKSAEMESDREIAESHFPAPFRFWLCLCLANMFEANSTTQKEAFTANVHERLFERMKDSNADVRAAASFALGCLLESPPKKGKASRELLQPSPGQTGPTPLVPQRLPPNMVVPGVSPAGTATLPVSLQPSFANAPGMANLHWHPQHQPQHQPQITLQQPMPGPIPGTGTLPGPISGTRPGTIPGVQPMPPMQPGLMPGGQHGMLNQPLHLRPQSQPYMMHGMPMQPTLGGPNPGFMVGTMARPGSLDGQVFGSPGQLIPPGLHHTHDVTPQRNPSVYDDRRRLELDLAILEVLVEASDDGSSVVRYEVTIASAAAVEKYLDAFLHVANQQSAGHLEDAHSKKTNKCDDPPTENPNESGSRPPNRYDIDLENVDSESLDRFQTVWKMLRKLQHHDPHPEVARAANDVVMFVHENLMRRRSDQVAAEDDGSRSKVGLSGIEEESHGVVQFDSKRSRDSDPPRSDGPPHRSNQMIQGTMVLRRVASELAKPVGVGVSVSMEHNALSSTKALPRRDGADSKSKLEYNLPKSKLYEWKKSIFMDTLDAQRDQSYLDPLSPVGATAAYQERRNYLMMETGQTVGSRFERLTPKPPKNSRQSIEELMTTPDDNTEDDAVSIALKQELELREARLLRNTGVKMTSIVRFHPYEDVLVACGAEDGVTVWDTQTGRRVVPFINGNPKGSRMTTAMWLNAASTSLFLIGSDDGSARIWDGLVENNGDASIDAPNLVSAFFAAPDVKAGSRGRSGLVCEWQQYSGTLIAGGDTNFLRCWDLEAEKCGTVLETDTSACLTTLTSAWDYESLGTEEPKGSPGIGPSILVGGYSDGSLKVFDIRCKNAVSEAQSGAKSWTKRRRPTKYNEHNSWIVNTTFTGYGGYGGQVVTGSVAGDIKAWDLRMTTSQRTLEVQRSTMTALAVHKRIPVVATGSHAQFIKILTLDGETLRVIRYHEEMSNHRIGPVSCLEFHPYKPLLVAGATDTFVSIYAARGKSWLR